MASENSLSQPDNPNSEISFDDLLKLIFGSAISPDDFLRLLYEATRRSCRIYRRYFNEDDVEDIAQSIALSLIKHDYHGLLSINNRSSLKAWLQTIANHETFQFYRSQRASISLEDLSLDEQAYPPSQDDKVLYNEIAYNDKLTGGQRNLLELMFLGMKTNEIAEQYGIDPGSVSKSKSRLRNKVGKLLKSGGGRPIILAGWGK
ncbi:MAG TPA: sigma-70 family RNA polymerase sigma factor [Blastocatellia bacterium]|jgi:RNA polymerase sigma factor (sigma-70 family)|nr:sigma-70 family RNA polymerase sigma factor [Blastocatellia bacterium]